ncbi:hypothetical protein CCACVL1_13047 [Corchorus capsularis]|uniref:Uncharacterized protein n=1 Tax=Corchorus capsularis TaxID=210143 RepID=A0A1R3ICD0_COCAP|nr:hypothetical protein CCACVL1_13047 [Corchorus capsularis]
MKIVTVAGRSSTVRAQCSGGWWRG